MKFILRKKLLLTDRQYLWWGLYKKSRNLKAILSRLFYPLIKFKIENRAKSNYKTKQDLQNDLLQLIGDFSRFRTNIPKKEKAVIIKNANQVLNGFYDILGSKRARIKPIDWHTDFKSGYTWPKGKFYLKYVQVDYHNSADVKVPRELSRSHHLLYLGQAYLLTDDENYTKEFMFQIENWIKENPMMYSINWGCTMDVSIRAVNWIYAMNMFMGSSIIDEQFCRRIWCSLFEHGYFIFNNLEKKYKNSNNHYFSNLSGLIYLGLLFNLTEEGKRWFDFALPEFYQEVRCQFLPSGVSFEKSINYHRLMAELSVYPYIVLRKNGINIPLDIRDRLKKVFDFVLHYIKPDGTAPVIGDQDDGRFLPFGIYRNIDHRYLVTIGAIIFKESQYKRFGPIGLIDAFFLIGEQCEKLYDSIKTDDSKIGSKAFNDAGFCVMRKDDKYMFISNSGAAAYPDQTSRWGSHAHPDLLSFELAIGDFSFLVDPGTYLYSSDPKERNRFRSTRMHNTVVVDDLDQHHFTDGNIFSCDKIAEPVDFSFTCLKNEEIFYGSHNGYARLSEPVMHSRRIVFDKRKITWTIVDILSGDGEHSFKWYFHFNSGIDFEIKKNRVKTRLRDSDNLIMKFTSVSCIRLNKSNDFVSNAYGIKEPSYTLEVFSKGRCPIELKTAIEIEEKHFKKNE